MAGEAAAAGAGLNWASVLATGAAGGLQMYGANQAAESAQNAAMASYATAGNNLRNIRARSDQIQDTLSNAITPSMMANYNNVLANQERVVQRQEQLAQSISPALFEAGKQAHQLMLGQSAPVLDNMKNQRQLQRQNLLDTLRQQYGAGAENSSAGQQALQRFDSETTNQLSQAQQQYLQQMTGTALSGGASIAQTSGASNALYNNINADNPMTQNAYAKANALQNTTNLESNALSNMAGFAGAGNVAGNIMGKAYSSLGSSLMSMAGGAAGYDQSTDGSGPTPTNNTNTVGNKIGGYAMA